MGQRQQEQIWRYFCIKQTEGRGTESRGKKALHETPRGTAERTQSREEVSRPLLLQFVLQVRGAQPDIRGKRLHFHHLDGSVMQPGRGRQQTALLESQLQP